MSSTDAGMSRVLHQEAAGDDLTAWPGARRVGQARRSSSRRRFFFARDERLRLVVDVGRDDHLGEDLGDRLGGRRVERAVERR